MSRSLSGFVRLYDRIAPAAIVSVSEGIRTDSATGKLMIQLLAVFAEHERDMIRQRTKEALASLREANRVTGKVPYGFKAIDGILAPDSEEQAGLALIRQCRADGMSYRAIARAMDGSGYRARTGKAWSSSTIAAILRRKT